jgi:hypothetical protein
VGLLEVHCAWRHGIEGRGQRRIRESGGELRSGACDVCVQAFEHEVWITKEKTGGTLRL